MYIINDSIIEKVLKRKFISLVGVTCEKLEDLEKLNLSKKELIDQIKYTLKKNSYETMREIKEQLSSFSEGTTVSVDFKLPTQ